jgi:hypothetical protein
MHRFILHLAMLAGFYFLDFLDAAVKIEAITAKYSNSIITVLPGQLAGRAEELSAHHLGLGLPEFNDEPS